MRSHESFLLFLAQLEIFFMTRKYSDERFTRSETGAFKQRYLFVLLVMQSDQVYAGTSAIVDLFCFRRQYVANMHGLHETDGNIKGH